MDSNREGRSQIMPICRYDLYITLKTAPKLFNLINTFRKIAGIQNQYTKISSISIYQQ
jgi:hypothetical protein